MTVDEAKAVVARHSDRDPGQQLVKAARVLAAAVREDDFVHHPDADSCDSSVEIFHREKAKWYCLRKDLPKPTRTVVLNEWACHCELSGWYMLWSEKKPGDGLWNTGNTREIEVQHE